MSKGLNKAIINVTSNAWDKITAICKKQDVKRFMFSATSGGCSGYNYKLELLGNKEYKDISNEQSKFKPTILKNGENELVIEPSSEFLLLGTTIDYIHEDFNKAIFENKFIFTPDKELALGCGCGVSFTPKD